MIKHLYELIPLLIDKKKLKVVVVMAHDDHVIEAIAKVINLGYIEAYLIGHRDLILGLCIKHNITSNYHITHETDPEIATSIAIERIKNGQGDLLMKGIIDSKVLMKGIVNRDTGIKKEPLLSHIAIAEIPALNRLVFATDMAMNIQPTIEQKIQSIYNVHKVANLLNWGRLLIGMISSAEKVNIKLQSSVEAQSVKDFFIQSPLENTVIDGPFALDNLLSEEACKIKGIASPVGGRANVLVFPNLDAGNVFYKSITYLSQAELAGFIFGATVPIILTSRADSSTTKMYSILLALVIAHAQIDSHN